MRPDPVSDVSGNLARYGDGPPEIAQAVALHRHGRLSEAANIYAEIVKREPRNIRALHYLGLIKAAQQERKEAFELLNIALERCDRTIDADPTQAENFIERARILNALHRHFEALVSCDRALAIVPDCARAHRLRGDALYALNRFQAAVTSYQKALALEADDIDTIARLAWSLCKLKRLDDGLAMLDSALALKPRDALARNTRAEILASLKRYNEAMAEFEFASLIDPMDVQPRWRMAEIRLLRGDFRRGWEQYECRWSHPVMTPRRFNAPLWLGEAAITGKTILLHAEQGLGDTIQFVRYAVLAANRGATVLVEVQPELHTLISRMNGVAAVLSQPGEQTENSRIDGAPRPPATEAELPPFDYHCPLMSLPLAFKTELDSVPAPIPYLFADPQSAARWAMRLPRGKRRVGLVWSGSPFHRDDHNRSTTLRLLSTLLSEPCDFVSLQKTVAATDQNIIRGYANLLHFGEELEDLDDTAALIASLDLVISVDTAVAHLAAAMGKPVWILLPWAPEWRWMLSRDDSPWYPNVRLFRQPRLDDWESVIERVRTELQSWLRLP